MNSRERVLTVLEHKEPDRVPIGEWGIDHDHVSKILDRHTYWRNRKDCTIAMWEGRRDEVVESKKADYAELIENLDYDVIPVHLVAPKSYICEDPPKKIGDGVWQDSKGTIFKYASSNDSIMHMTHPPAKDDVTEQEIDELIENIPDFYTGEFELVDSICEKYGRSKMIVFRGINLDSTAMSLFGGDTVHQLMMTVLNPEGVRRAMEYALAYNIRLIKACAERDIGVVMGGRDYGNSIGCIESPKTIHDLYMPYHKRFATEVLKHEMIPFLHCCGCVWDIMDDIVDAGYKAYQSIQATAGMNWAKLKKEYGDKLTLWAGVQCETLIEGSSEQVEQEVQGALDVLMPGGGFIFGSTNSVQYGANTDNYLRALEIVRKKGNYK